MPDGLGTALKPATELIILARKPLIGSVAENVLAYGVGALNIGGCSIEGDGISRFPANLLHDGSPAVLSAFPAAGAGSAARFFFSAKASKLDRLGSLHPTVKPVDLMRWLVRLVTPAGGLVLDPFAGSGTTGHAAVCEGMRAVLIEREPKFCQDIARRMERMDPNGQPKARKKPARPRPPDPWAGTLFAGSARATQTKVAETACAARQNRAKLATQAQPSSSPPTTDSAPGAPDDGQAAPVLLHAAE